MLLYKSDLCAWQPLGQSVVLSTIFGIFASHAHWKWCGQVAQFVSVLRRVSFGFGSLVGKWTYTQMSICESLCVQTR